MSEILIWIRGCFTNLIRMFLLFTMVSCSCRSCGDISKVGDATTIFTFQDRNTNENLYPRFSNKGFYIDTLQIFNAEGEKIKFYNGSADDGYAYSIQLPFYSNEDTIGQGLCKTYYLYLSQSDTDTLQLCYRLAAGKCNTEVKNFQAFYNNVAQSVTDGGGYTYYFDVKK